MKTWKDVYVRWDVKKKLREEANVRFSALRDYAIQFAEYEVAEQPSTHVASCNAQ